ncbi:MAG: hypothetical protein AB1Z98_24540 [Nannocystaceae bacterium]
MLGLAAAQACDGQLDAAVEGLREAAVVLADHHRQGDAMSLYARALMLDPNRLEIHLDVALLEKAMGRHDVAVSRIECVADRFISQGKADEAARLLRHLASWEDEAPPPPSTETVVCSTFLLRPDGTPFMDDPSPEPAPEQHIERAVSAPIVLDPFANHDDDDDDDEYEPEPDFETEVTTVASLPLAPPRPPPRVVNGKFRLERAPRPGMSRPSPSPVKVQGAVGEAGQSLRSGTILSRTPSASRGGPPQPPRNAPRVPPRRSGESVVVRRTLRTDIEEEVTQRLRRVL